MSKITVNFDDLKAEGITSSWTWLNKLIDTQGFPPGRMVGKRRLFTRREVEQWLESRPATKLPPRGRAKELAARGKAVRA